MMNRYISSSAVHLDVQPGKVGVSIDICTYVVKGHVLVDAAFANSERFDHELPARAAAQVGKDRVHCHRRGFTDPNMRLALTAHGAGADRLRTHANRHWSAAQEVGAA
jgi:hypothetical protein